MKAPTEHILRLPISCVMIYISTIYPIKRQSDKGTKYKGEYPDRLSITIQVLIPRYMVD